MVWLVDAFAILLLTGCAFGAVGSGDAVALAPALWLAFATPALVRSDLLHRRLPNALTLPAVALVAAGSTIAATRHDNGGQDPTSVLVATTATALAGCIAWRAHALGLGDVKLATALVGSTVLAAPDQAWVFAAATSVVGVGAAGWASLRRRTIPARARPPSIPFGPCLLAGYWSALAVGAVT